MGPLEKLVAFNELLNPAGQALLAEAQALQPREIDFLRHFEALRRRFPDDLARLALEIAILRGEAIAKFPQADRMYFTREALEQASGYLVAAYRSHRYQGFKRLADLGCSIGGDTLALAEVAATLAIDLDPLRLQMAHANLQALGLAGQATFIQADLTAPLPVQPGGRRAVPLALFFDPARRARGKRFFRVKDYQPALHTVLDWLPGFPALGVKISPGVDLDELQAFDAEVEFISLNGELKEAVLWFGPLKTVARRATLLPQAHTLESNASDRGVGANQRLPTSEPLAYLYEPDPAVLRAGLVETLGQSLEAAQLDPDIAYLTCSQLQATPFASAYAVEAWFPFNLKQLRRELHRRGVERVVVKKRGSPIQPEDLIRALRLASNPGASQPEKILFLTHLRGQPITILGHSVKILSHMPGE